MARQLVFQPGFIRPYGRLQGDERDQVDRALKYFQNYLRTGEAPLGLGIKHLGSRTYEFRAGLARRVIYVVEGDQIVLSLLGTHDEGRRFLRRQ